MPYRAGAAFNHGGIIDSVELLMVAAGPRGGPVRPRPTCKTGVIRIEANVRNASDADRKTAGSSSPSPRPPAARRSASGPRSSESSPPATRAIEAELRVDNRGSGTRTIPYLYRVTARVGLAGSGSFDERSTRCGFRDFRFPDGYFRLNGRRIYLRCAHTCNHYPIGLQFPHDPDLLRRDLLNMKVMGFNTIRFIWGGAARLQLDLCDEIGLMVYEESYAAWPIADSPEDGRAIRPLA